MRFEETTVTRQTLSTTPIVWFSLPALWMIQACDRPHEDHHDHPGNAHGREESKRGPLRLSVAALQEFGVELSEAGPARLVSELTLPGEIVPNADRISHIVPRVSGIVREVRKSVGDRVTAGEVLAILDSHELADAKAAWMAACERASLNEENFKRAEDLWKKNIYTEKEYLEARKDLAEATIERRVSRQKLLALGIPLDQLDSLRAESDDPLTRYEIVAPFEGTVIERHIVLGEAVEANADVFTVADLGTVWIDLSVYGKDLERVSVGLPVEILLDTESSPIPARVSYCCPLVREGTRTGLARAVLDNPIGRLRPGTFVSGRLKTQEFEVPVGVPRSAIATIDGQPAVFVREKGEFRPRPVREGRSDRVHVEIEEGLSAGETYVRKGAFTLKAELEKSGFGHGHAH
jgi:cobalt-zinc-cadmium efflux system membrane fusion protein